MFHLVLLSAMPEEIGNIKKNLHDITELKFGDLEIFTGIYKNSETKKDILLTFGWSGWGKVSSARAITRMISLNNLKPVDLILFTGVAGAINEELNQWDVVLANEIVQYDLDARPLFERYVIPALGYSNIKLNKKWTENIYNFLSKKDFSLSLNNSFKEIHKGLIGTGDKFISDKGDVLNLRESIPNILAVEMEGASVAQVAMQENIPCVILRVISDNANEESQCDFSKFLESYKIKAWDLLNLVLFEISVKYY